ncbi:hypothetical protein ACFQ6O_40610 [Streptomyces sp. NPDC056441]|uniref:hypothetical protein n=1 Tax=Streptomyces sp. NPDC056441 TaxID=3345817 RepID=UPI00368DC3B9
MLFPVSLGSVASALSSGRCARTRPTSSEDLAAASPEHPWTGVKFSSAWGSREVLDAVLVRPDLVAEISADTAIDRVGVYRHPLRYMRLRDRR